MNKTCQDEQNGEAKNHIQNLSDEISRLELELAYISGKLDQTSDEEEKKNLNERFLIIARAINDYKRLLNNSINP